MQPIAADITEDLAECDELLTRFGRWAMKRHRIHRCASAEGMYQAPPNDDDRAPREVIMPPLDAMAVQRAIARLPALERTVLSILYVPQRLPPQALLRIAKIPPATCRERHRTGLVMFRNLCELTNKRNRAIESRT